MNFCLIAEMLVCLFLPKKPLLNFSKKKKQTFYFRIDKSYNFAALKMKLN